MLPNVRLWPVEPCLGFSIFRIVFLYDFFSGDFCERNRMLCRPWLFLFFHFAANKWLIKKNRCHLNLSLLFRFSLGPAMGNSEENPCPVQWLWIEHGLCVFHFEFFSFSALPNVIHHLAIYHFFSSIFCAAENKIKLKTVSICGIWIMSQAQKKNTENSSPFGSVRSACCLCPNPSWPQNVTKYAYHIQWRPAIKRQMRDLNGRAWL